MVCTITYENGIIATLFLTIFGPFCEDQETLEIVGETGRLRMERHSGEIDLVRDFGRSRDIVKMASLDRDSSHFGADKELVRAMRRFVDGARPNVGVPEGHASLQLVLAAQKSMRAHGRPVDPETQEFLY